MKKSPKTFQRTTFGDFYLLSISSRVTVLAVLLYKNPSASSNSTPELLEEQVFENLEWRINQV